MLKKPSRAFLISWLILCIGCVLFSVWNWEYWRQPVQFIVLIALAVPGTAGIIRTVIALYNLIPQSKNDITPNFGHIRKKYIQYLLDAHRYLALRGIGLLEDVPLQLSLLDLYVPLKARQQLPHGGNTWERFHIAGRNVKNQIEKDQIISKSQSVLELIKINSGLVLLGDPGAGKTTFLKYLTLQLAMGNGGKIGIPDYLPVIIPLVEYADSMKEKNIGQFIGEYLCNKCADSSIDVLITRELEKGQVLILLDGLDEVGEQSIRGNVVTRVLDFYNAQRRKGNKFIITSRVIGYREIRPIGEGLVEAMLTDFEKDEIEEFVKRWTIALEKLTQGDTQVSKFNAENEQHGLLKTIRKNKGIRRLAANPLLLTILALMKKKGVTLPERRVELYDFYVRTIVSIWNKARSISGHEVGKDLDVYKTVQILAPLALWMHEENPELGLVKSADMQDKLGEIFTKFDSRNSEEDARNFIKDVQANTALLLERGTGQYGFIHLTFEEYLAAVGIALQGQGNADRIAKILIKNAEKSTWREVILLTVAYVCLIQHLESVAGDIVEKMTNPRTKPMSVILASEAIADVKSGDIPNKSKEIVLNSLKPLINSDKIVAPLRCRTGDALAKLGGLRPEVLHVDEMQFCFVPGGEFWMGSDPSIDKQAGKGEQKIHKLHLPDYWIAKNPVTNAQYKEFVGFHACDEADYWKEAKDAGVWDEEGIQGRFDEKKRHEAVDFGEPFNLPNHPIMGVTWYEALAFCRWLEKKWQAQRWLPDKWMVGLPSEAEWEKAARGGLQIPKSFIMKKAADFTSIMESPARETNPSEKRIYPWQGVFNAENANTDETGISTTSAVGCFANGSSPYGLQDMSGNVWDWTCSLWGFKYPYDFQQTEREDIKAGKDKARIVRGGSFSNRPEYARCACRFWYAPDLRFDDIGFRVAVFPFFKSSDLCFFESQNLF